MPRRAAAEPAPTDRETRVTGVTLRSVTLAAAGRACQPPLLPGDPGSRLSRPLMGRHRVLMDSRPVCDGRRPARTRRSVFKGFQETPRATDGLARGLWAREFGGDSGRLQ